jgi:hypothetical protein
MFTSSRKMFCNILRDHALRAPAFLDLLTSKNPVVSENSGKARAGRHADVYYIRSQWAQRVKYRIMSYLYFPFGGGWQVYVENALCTVVSLRASLSPLCQISKIRCQPAQKTPPSNVRKLINHQSPILIILVTYFQRPLNTLVKPEQVFTLIELRQNCTVGSMGPAISMQVEM